jgi:sec-independent protein translocase protein TatB
MGIQVSLLSMGTPPPIEIANLGMADSLIIMVIALVVFGPRKLPQIGRQIGKLMYEFRKASNDFKFQMEEELRNAEDADRRKKDEERQRAMALAAPPPAAPPIESAASVEPTLAPTASIAVQTSAAQAENPAEESLPRIMPPSTGDPVPAVRPWSPPGPTEVVVSLSAEPEEVASANPVADAVPVEGNSAKPDHSPSNEGANHG